MCPRSLLQTTGPALADNRGPITRERETTRAYSVCRIHSDEDAYTLDVALKELLIAAEIMGEHGNKIKSSLHNYWSQPWIMSLVGQSGVGKSTLIDTLANRKLSNLSNARFTEQITQFELGSDYLIDTPGLDTPHASIATLEPVAENSDLLIWVIDGRKRISSNERLVLANIRKQGQPVHVVLTQLDDCSSSDRQAAIQRARMTLSHIYPLSVRIVDANVPAHAVSYLARRVPWGSPRRLQWLTEGLGSVHSWLQNHPPDPEPQVHLPYVLQRWRTLVKATTESIIDQLENQVLQNQQAAYELFARRTRLAAAAYHDWIEREPAFRRISQEIDPADIPSLPDRATTPLDRLQSIIGTKRQAVRSIQYASRAWCVTGESAIEAWITRASEGYDPSEMEAYDRLEQGLVLAEHTLQKAQRILRKN